MPNNEEGGKEGKGLLKKVKVKGLSRTKRLMSMTSQGVGAAASDDDDEATADADVDAAEGGVPATGSASASAQQPIQTGASKMLESTLKRSAEFALAELKPRSLFQLVDEDNGNGDVSDTDTDSAAPRSRSCQSAGINVHHCASTQRREEILDSLHLFCGNQADLHAFSKLDLLMTGSSSSSTAARWPTTRRPTN